MCRYRPIVLCQCDPERAGYSLRRLALANGIFWVLLLGLLLLLLLVAPVPNILEVRTTGITQQIFRPSSWQPEGFYHQLGMRLSNVPENSVISKKPIEVSLCMIPGKGAPNLPLARTIFPVSYVGNVSATYYTWWSRVLYETMFKLNKNSTISCGFIPNKSQAGFDLYIVQGQRGLKDIASGSPNDQISGLLASQSFVGSGRLPEVRTTKSGPVYCVAAASTTILTFDFAVHIRQSVIDAHLNATCVQLWTNDTQSEVYIDFIKTIRYLMSTNNTESYLGPTVHVWGVYKAGLWYGGVVVPCFLSVAVFLLVWGVYNWWTDRKYSVISDELDFKSGMRNWSAND